MSTIRSPSIGHSIVLKGVDNIKNKYLHVHNASVAMINHKWP